MAEHSAGILLYRRHPQLEVWIAHMGGPFWARKDEGAWSIPKGLIEPGEQPLEAALREFEEETGSPAPDTEYVLLGDFPYSSGKVITVFAGESDFSTDIHSNEFELEWPPRSGKRRSFPELDRAEWCDLEIAAVRLVKGQRPMLRALETSVAQRSHPA
jgi:predicted NUDIX family NTP pyrophosphohydrolase